MTKQTKNTAKQVTTAATVKPVSGVERDGKGVVVSKVFNAKLTGFINAQQNQRDNLQDLIVWGLEQYSVHGNTVYLSKALNKCIGVKTLPTNSIKEYIKAHADVKWSKDSDNNMVFSKASGKGTPRKVIKPTVAWYNHETQRSSQATADIDAMARLKSAYTSITTALDGGKVKADQVDKAKGALAALKPFLA